MLASLRNSCNDLITFDAGEKQEGVVTRICSFKYGFLKSDNYENLFFHFSELSDEAKAFVEPGSKISFYVEPNPNASQKMKAVKIEVLSDVDNAFKNIEGVVQCEMKNRGFCFIDADETTFLFHSTNLVDDEASKASGNTVAQGHKVIFDAEWNHKYSPPKPFARNVRIVPGQIELNAAAASLELNAAATAERFESATWQRNSRLQLSDDDSEGEMNKNQRGSVSDRASGLKASAPVRRWSRTTAGSKADKPAGGLRLTVTTCKFSRKCNRADCWFDHPNGRQMDDGLSLADDSSSSDSDDSEKKISSMGKASLRLLVTALVEESAGKSGYLAIRNTLQRSEYVGRPLTREEKRNVGDILEEMDNQGPLGRASFSRRSSFGSLDRSTQPPFGRSSASTRRRAPMTRSSFTGGRVSLSDLCKDPSLHSRLSAANGICA